MKKVFRMGVVFLGVFVLGFTGLMVSQQIHEEVTVTVLEVPIRVLQKGQVVKGLTEGDFEVFEKGKKQEIIGFDIVSRRITAPIEQPQMGFHNKRVFILIFNVFDYFGAVGEAIDNFFEDYFLPGDQFIIVTENQLFNFEMAETIGEVKTNLKEKLKEHKKRTSTSIFTAYREIGEMGNALYGLLTGRTLGTGTAGTFGSGSMSIDPTQAIMAFYENYQRVWKSYKRMYLMPEIEFYRELVNQIKIMEGEKWIICFQQRDLFPQLRKEGEVEREITTYLGSLMDRRGQMERRQIESAQMELQRSMAISRNFPREALEGIFLDANLTFHLLLMQSTRSIDSQSFELVNVDHDLESCFKDLSFITGGYTTFSHQVAEALKAAAENEDYHYVLWISPESKALKEKDIKVNVNLEDAQVIFRKHFAKQMNPPVVIKGFKAKDKAISFVIDNYERMKMGEVLNGIAEVKITLYDENSQIVFDSKRKLQFPNPEADIGITFNTLDAGDYFIIIEVRDMISNEKHIFSKPIML